MQSFAKSPKLLPEHHGRRIRWTVQGSLQWIQWIQWHHKWCILDWLQLFLIWNWCWIFCIGCNPHVLMVQSWNGNILFFTNTENWIVDSILTCRTIFHHTQWQYNVLDKFLELHGNRFQNTFSCTRFHQWFCILRYLAMTLTLVKLLWSLKRHSLHVLY